MRGSIALLFVIVSMSAFEAEAREANEKEEWLAAGHQVIGCLVDMHVDYSVFYDAVLGLYNGSGSFGIERTKPGEQAETYIRPYDRALGTTHMLCCRPGRQSDRDIFVC